MLKNDIIKRLERLQGLEKIEVILENGISHIVYRSTLANNISQEVIIAPCVNQNSTAIIPYHAIAQILPSLS